MHPKDLSIADFTYDLPEERIARYPLAERDESKLLIYKKGEIETDKFRYLAHHLPIKSLLVFNNTKVVEARLLFEKPTGGKIEIFCLEPHEQYGDITTAMLQQGKVWWKCLVGGAKKWKEGALHVTVENEQGPLVVTAEKIEEAVNDTFLIALTWNRPAMSFAEVLHAVGAIPLPPYLNRSAEDADKERYQTIYAQHHGSVAAPTAGLHFTEKLFSLLEFKNITTSFVTLHVGAGTFKPVKSDTMLEHEMHSEFVEVSFELVQQLLDNLNGTIVAVGTTSLRTIESIYWAGAQLMRANHEKAALKPVSQWEPYNEQQKVSAVAALVTLATWMKLQGTTRVVFKTQILIAPGYQFRIAKALITNFHQPRSTLLLLVAAITGDDWKKIYNYALENDFRFLSYGDGSLIWI